MSTMISFRTILKRESLKKADNEGIPGKTHYLLHRAVVRHDKEATKFRIVSDGSAKVDKCISLNEALYSGPSLLCMIFDILLRFRLHKYILLSGIKQAFLNVGVRAEDPYFPRFLWFEDLFPDDENVTAFRILRVVFGLICSTLLLNATIKVHSGKYLSDAGFELRKWGRNLDEMKEKIYDVIKETVSDVCVEKKVFGLAWDISKDTIKFYFERLVEEAFDLPVTKRSIRSISARIYDPSRTVLSYYF